MDIETIGVIADIGTAIGTFALAVATYLTLMDLRNERMPNIKVKTFSGKWRLRASPKNQKILGFSASNEGAETTLDTYGLIVREWFFFEKEIKSTSGLAFADQYEDENDNNKRIANFNSFPFRISRNTSCSIGMFVDDIAMRLTEEGFKGKIKLIGYFKDQAGKQYKSKPADFDIREFIITDPVVRNNGAE